MVLVLDNASTDKALISSMEILPEVHLLAMRGSHGFSSSKTNS